jgi:hypothetical protein
LLPSVDGHACILFFISALSYSLAVKDWPTVEACRHQIQGPDYWAAAGVAMRTYVPLGEEEEEVGIFHIAAEVHYGYSPGL